MKECLSARFVRTHPTHNPLRFISIVLLSTLPCLFMGLPLYEKYGFIKMEHEMELPENAEKEIDNGH